MNSIYCLYCGKDVEEEAKFCQFCGKSDFSLPSDLSKRTRSDDVSDEVFFNNFKYRQEFAKRANPSLEMNKNNKVADMDYEESFLWGINNVKIGEKFIIVNIKGQVFKVPVEHIAMVNVDPTPKVKTAIPVLVLLFLSITIFELNIIVEMIFVFIAVLCFSFTISISTTSGKDVVVNAWMYEISKLKEVEKKLQTLIEKRMEETSISSGTLGETEKLYTNEMSEKSQYKKVFSLEKNLYAEGMPIIIKDGAILVDNQKTKTLARLIFMNLSDKEIIAIRGDITIYDVTKKYLEDVPFEFLDFKAGNNEKFGFENFITLNRNNARHFTLKIKEVIFSDLSIWKSEGEEFQAIPSPTTTYEVLKYDEIVRQYEMETFEGANYVPSVILDLWYCACGALNKRSFTTCCACKNEYHLMVDKFDAEILKEHATQRIEQRNLDEFLKQYGN